MQKREMKFDRRWHRSSGNVLGQDPSGLRCNTLPGKRWRFQLPANRGGWPGQAVGKASSFLGNRIMHQSNALGSYLSRLKPNLVLDLLRASGVQIHHRILDVGCGAGMWLSSLANAGFLHLFGVDLFIAGDTNLPNGVTIRKGQISEVDGIYD